ncbi:TonB-dependent receptor [Methylobacillus rhizosphaerae]|uniref:TonB-dependent receptor n=1 Tax=Methylobacillus rhizosphaerae TaxID=551994 RepID=A0A238YEW4_9PROT|nr:TonB-dependent receptor [Methylobacillus rhizosphaerae]SNR69328.1 TonB-dependent receptor [Methylobacillus rhizosphaerae]
MQVNYIQLTRENSGCRFPIRVTAAAIALMGNSLAYAEDTAVVLPVVSVVGQAASMDSALDVQQMSDNIVSVVHADDIGQLPDTNAAEALQRIPGISIERDQGEGRYVRIRGLGPDLNAVTINGSLVPAPESDRRAVSLDVLPAGLIRSLEVSKTLMPSQDANSIGGTVEVKTISAFDHKGTFYSLEAGASHDTNTDQESPNFAAAWSDRFLDGKLGIALGVNSSKRKFGSDNAETGGAWDLSGPRPALEEFQRRDYSITRERQGGIFNLDYRPNDKESYYLRTLYSRFIDKEVRQRHNIEFDDPQQVGELGTAESSRELKSREETQDIASVVLGGERTFNDWKVAVAMGASRASQDTPDAIDAATFESGQSYLAGYSSSRLPRLISDGSINNASDYELDSIELSKQKTVDRERNLKVDIDHKWSALGVDSELKFGAKASRRKKTNEMTAWEVDGGDFGNPGLGDFLGNHVDYDFGNYGPTVSSSSIRHFLSGVNLSDYINAEESRINDFSMREDINAAYVQNTFNYGMWRVLAGMRYEQTKFSANGTSVTDGDYTAVQAGSKYHHWLPALHIRRDLDNDTSIRAAITNSVVRPTFGQLAPGVVINGDEASFGNPSLNPMESRNLDLGIEKRIGYAGVLSAYVFHKDIKNFVYRTDMAGSGIWADFDQADTFANGSSASVKGLELAYAQSFREVLPAPWNGLLLSANATFVSSSAKIAGYSDGVSITRNIALPSQSDRTFNLVVGYEQGPLNMRLAANYKSKYLLEVTDISDSRADQYVDAQTQYDFSARYNLNRQMQLAFEVLNITDEKYYVYTGNRSLNSQYESYGRTYRLSMKIATF